VTAGTPPPPISGGTLIALKDGLRAVAADPDRDAVYIVDLGARSAKTVALQAGDEPGRLVEDGAGHVHVALRGASGAVVTIDPVSATVTGRQTVCPAPRGITWDASTDLVWVACATGELVALPASGGSPAHSFVVARDLRDVIASGDSVAVSQFRAAHVLRLYADGTVARTDVLYAPALGFAPDLAWRVAAGPSGTLAVVHQEASALAVTTGQDGYGGCGAGRLESKPSTPIEWTATPVSDGGFGEAGLGEAGAAASPSLDCSAGGNGNATGSNLPASVTSLLPLGVDTSQLDGGVAELLPLVGCFAGGVVRSVFTLLGPDGSVLVSREVGAVLPVDLAVSPDGKTVAVAASGNAHSPSLSTVLQFSVCGARDVLTTTLGDIATGAQPTAVAFDSSGDLLVQAREPAQLWILGSSGGRHSVTLSTTSRRDTGHDLFHVQAGQMIACASCHPEGRDDGHVWHLDGHLRRTPSLSGTIAGTAPYHWPGDFKDMSTLLQNVYTVRMGGAELTSAQLGVIQSWVQGLPAPPAPSWVDASAAGRGEAIFGRDAVACATCHSGPKLTNNQTMDVGTGTAYQVPPLVGVGWRAPLMHDGCAATMADRFGSCSTPGHGDLSSLSSADISDLAAYLETL
jgi:DNA-binding beta-propeller fold protein YncE/mono/diheme cytochrome c family protein